MKEVVHCKTLAQWIQVKQHLKHTITIHETSFYQFPYIPLFEDNCGNEYWVQNNDFIIYSFAEWYKRKGINNEENYNYLIEFLNKLGIK